MKLLLATTNAGKIIEIGECLRGLPIELVTTKDLDKSIPEPHEHGATFAENALLKAQYYHEQTGLPSLADDSGIIVDALKDELGIHTRRWGAGPKASDKEWIEYFLERMRHEPNKRSRFVCAMAFVDGKGNKHECEGICEGVITDALEADYLPGLPLSACFRPDGHGAVFSALSIEQKNSTSHRGKALAILREELKKYCS